MTEPLNPFLLLGLPQRFDLTADQIHVAHLTNVAAAHPDLAPPVEASSPAVDADPAASVNDAKRILENPESRANALLHILGGPSKESDRSLPPGFLTDILETREAVEAAIASGDQAAVLHWRSWAGVQREAYQVAILTLFRALAPTPSPTQLAVIRVQLNAWRYIERLIEQLELDHDGLHGHSPGSSQNTP
jgi:hypothetical protein